jgi:menaquinone-dependent protoporphyrinogen oxidase
MAVLVAYASRHGATQGIAARIAEQIAEAGIVVDLLHVDTVESLNAYDAVVFGAPVYDQSWPPEADRFVDQQRDALAAHPLWLSASDRLAIRNA